MVPVGSLLVALLLVLGLGVGLPLCVVLAWDRRQRVRQWLESADLLALDQMTGVQFEQRLAALFRQQGLRVQPTPATGDFGADLLVYTATGMLVVQAKRSARTVGVRAVQEAVAARAYYGAARAMVVTNATFSEPAQRLAAQTGVDLVDRFGLAQWLQSTDTALSSMAPPDSRSSPFEQPPRIDWYLVDGLEALGPPGWSLLERDATEWWFSRLPACDDPDGWEWLVEEVHHNPQAALWLQNPSREQLQVAAQRLAGQIGWVFWITDRTLESMAAAILAEWPNYRWCIWRWLVESPALPLEAFRDATAPPLVVWDGQQVCAYRVLGMTPLQLVGDSLVSAAAIHAPRLS